MTEKEYNSAEEQYREMILAMSSEERKVYDEEQAKALRPTDKEFAGRDALDILYYGDLRRYAELEEKKDIMFSNWREHKNGDDENTYWTIQFKNDELIDTKIHSIQSDLDFIIEQIEKNSSKELIQAKIENLKDRFTAFPLCLLDCVNYIFTHIDSKFLSNLGHTDAWIFLHKYLRKSKGVKKTSKSNSKEYLTPEFINGDIETFYTVMLKKNFIEKDYSLKDFKNAFKGTLFKNINPIRFTDNFVGTSRVFLFQTLDKENFISIDSQKTMDLFICQSKDYYKIQKNKFRDYNINQINPDDTSITNIQEIRDIIKILRTTKK